MRMMMKMMKMSNMMNDHSSSSYHSDDNDMYDMFSEMLDSSSDRMDNYRSYDYSNQMGRMSHIKKKVESNFGPMEDILQETQLTEHEFFPLVMQLLHGKEMDYMTGGM